MKEKTAKKQEKEAFLNILKNIEKQLKNLIHIAVATKIITERSPKNILDSTVGIEFL